MSDQTQSGNPKRFACPICSKNLHSSAYRNAHVKVFHQNAGRHRCARCDKSFQNRPALEIHERTHTGEKPYPCQVCGTAFISKNALNSHHLNHHEEKVKCPFCSKQFGRLALKGHLNFHSTEKPFQCQLCPSKRFPSESRLKNHHRLCHAEKSLRCESCGNGFSKRTFKNHLPCRSMGLSLVLHSQNEQVEDDLDGSSNGSGQSQNDEVPNDWRASGDDVLDEEVQNDETGRDVSAALLGDRVEEANPMIPQSSDEKDDQKFDGQTSGDSDVLDEQNSRTKNDRDTSAGASKRDCVEDDDVIILSSDEEDDEDDRNDQPTPQRSAARIPNLNLSYEAEYRRLNGML